MIIAKGYVKNGSVTYTPGEIIPDGALAAEDLEWLKEIGLIRVDGTEAPKASEAPKAEEPKEAPAEEPEILPDVPEGTAPEVDAADAIVTPKKTTRKKGGKR